MIITHLVGSTYFRIDTVCPATSTYAVADGLIKGLESVMDEDTVDFEIVGREMFMDLLKVANAGNVHNIERALGDDIDGTDHVGVCLVDIRDSLQEISTILTSK
jgi:hypothetical protein